VFIEHACQFKTQPGQTIDPLVEVEVLGKKKYTAVKNGIGGANALCLWNEHIFFEPRNVVSIGFPYLCIGKRGNRTGKDICESPR
jgi:hypothetical protein